MNSHYLWTCIIGLSLGTFLIRVSFFYLYSYLNISKKTEKIMSYIPAAILPALFIPAVFFHKGHIDIIGGYERLLVLLIAALVCYKTKNMFITILFGLFVLFGITFFC